MTGPEKKQKVGERTHWVIVAETTSRTEADFAVNGLQSHDIPVVLDSAAGVFGNAGLALTSIYSGQTDSFKVKVPAEFEEEAIEIVKMFVGGGNEDDLRVFDEGDDIDE